MTTKNLSSQSIGAANEDMFLKAFDSTPRIELALSKKLDIELSKVISTISNQSADWDSRVQAIKHFRSLVNSGIADLNDDFHTTTLKTLEIPFQNNISDLRSQVVRETCITIAFLSCRLHQKFSRMAEVLLPSLIKLIPNSAKIISTSALVALRFIIQSTQSSRFIPIVKYQLSNSKSKDINRALCEIAERMITLWPPQIIERQLNDFQEILRLGIGNSDELARQFARRTFNAFAEHFREPADRLYNSLDQRLQRMLNNLSHGGGSTLSINGYGSQSSNIHLTGQSHHHLTSNHPSSSHQVNGSENYGMNSNSLVNRLKGSLNQPSLNSHMHHDSNTIGQSPSRIRTPTTRSTSAIDVAAQKRARQRAVYLSSIHHQPRNLQNIHLTPTKTLSSNHFSHISRTVNNSNHVNNSPTPSSIPTLTSPATHVINQQTSRNQLSNNNFPNVTSKNPTTSIDQNCFKVQQSQATTTNTNDGSALKQSAAYLMTVIQDETMAESQVVTTIKYFNSLIDEHSPEIVNQLVPELMPPLVIGIDNSAICVRKASVFAMVAIHAKVGLKEMEKYLSGLKMTQRKLLEVYIKKSKESIAAGS